MEDILYSLFSGEYDITPKRDKKQQELCEKRYTELEKVQAVFGVEFMDRLFNLEAEQAELQNFQYYRSGFLLGVRLMLETWKD